MGGVITHRPNSSNFYLHLHSRNLPADNVQADCFVIVTGNKEILIPSKLRFSSKKIKVNV